MKLPNLSIAFAFVVIGGVGIVGCQGQIKSDTIKTNKNTAEMFKSKVIVILSKPLDKDSYAINIQDYVENGKSFIPVFTTKEKFTESTNGADLGKPTIEIDGILLLSMMKGSKTLRVNPRLVDEQNLKASELMSQYKTEIEQLNAKLNKAKNDLNK